MNAGSLPVGGNIFSLVGLLKLDWLLLISLLKKKQKNKKNGLITQARIPLK